MLPLTRERNLIILYFHIPRLHEGLKARLNLFRLAIHLDR